MKIMILTLSLAGLLTGCASNNSGMGGTSDEYTGEQYANSTGRYHSNAVNGTGTVTATNIDREGISP